MLAKIRSNLPIKILSVVIAILFWFMVYTNENPIETRNLTITLSPINETQPANDNLRILNVYDTTAEITIRGRSSEVDKVSANDFTAYLDFSDVDSEDIESLEISGFDYLGDRNIMYELTGSGRIALSVDRIITYEIPIRVETTGEPEEGFFIAGTPVLKPAIFEVLDIKSLVTEVGSAVVTVDVDGMKGTDTVRKYCMVYDNDGQLINELSNKTAIDITVNIAKSVPVVVKTEGIVANDYISVSETAEPLNVLITGSEEDLAAINKVNTMPVSIDGVSESFEVNIGLQPLPAGVDFVSSGEVDVSVEIEQLQEKTLIFSANAIDIRYGLITKEYDILSDSVSLVVKGKQSQLDLINTSTVTAYIDVSNTADGAYPLPVRFLNLNEVEQISFPLVDLHIQTLRSFSVLTDDIFIDNREGGKYDYSFTGSTTTLKVIGHADLIEQISIENLNPTIDVSGYGEGTHNIPVNIKLPEGVSLNEAFTANVKITGKQP